VLGGELAKLPAFARRDFLDAWSYRATFVADIGALVIQVITFYYVGKMIDSTVLPSFGGESPSYVEYVSVGLAVTVFVAIALNRVAGSLRQEQWKGTLEVLMMTPTSYATIQLGSAVYDLVYIPVRTVIFLVVVALAFDLNLYGSGLPPAVLIVLVFIPFVWGLGLISAAAVLTFKGASIGTSVAVTLLTISSGAYFPLTLLPDWIETIAKANPLAIAIQDVRETLIGGTAWSGIPADLAVLMPMSLISILAGVFAFRLALARERRRGSLALY
jgi:ABC-2 type transport system permease protein